MSKEENTAPINSSIKPPQEVGLGFDQGVVSSDIGSRSEKEHNEDHYWPHENDRLPWHDIDYLIAGRLYIVADGVSGGLAGHEASQIAASTIAKSYYERILQLERPPEQNDVERILRNAVMAANQRLLARSHELRGETEESDKKRYLQTTIVCALLRGNRLTIANVGDSHLYRYRSGQVQLLYQPVQRHFVGTNLSRQDIEIVRHQDTITKEDILILCSDGLYNYLAPDNEPENAPDEMTDIFNGYLSKGIERVTHELLIKANDDWNEGGGDNITVMLIQPGAASQREVGDELGRLIRQAWGPNATQNQLVGLAEACKQRAFSQSEKSEGQIWSRRAAQLGYEAQGAKELREAQALYHQLALDFDKNHQLTQNIIELEKNAPEQPELANLTRRAAISLADSALIPPLQQARLQKAHDLLIRFAEAKDAQPILAELEQGLRILSTTAASRDDPSAQRGPSFRGCGSSLPKPPKTTKSSNGFSRSSPPKPPETTKAVTTNGPRFGVKTIVALLLIFIILSASAVFVASTDILSPAELAEGIPSVATDTTSDVGQAIGEETASATPVPATAVPSPTTKPVPASPSSPELQIIEATYELLQQEGGRKQLKLSTHLSLQDMSSLDPNTTLEVETRLPAGLSSTGAGKPKVERKEEPNSSEIIITQRVPLSKVDPSHALFESIIIIEPPHSREPTYTIPVIARLQDGAGDALYNDSKAIQVEPGIPHEAALSMAQSVTSQLLTINEALMFNVTITNTGQTWIDQVVLKPEQVPAELKVDGWQNQLDKLGALDAGEAKQIALPAQVKTDKPMPLDISAPLEGILADGSVVEASSAPVQLEIYAKGKIAEPNPASCAECEPAAPLRAQPGGNSAQNPELIYIEVETKVKVLEAVQTEDKNIWYFLEVMTPDGQVQRGWIWSERIALENPAVKGYLIDKASGN